MRIAVYLFLALISSISADPSSPIERLDELPLSNIVDHLASPWDLLTLKLTSNTLNKAIASVTGVLRECGLEGLKLFHPPSARFLVGPGDEPQLDTLRFDQLSDICITELLNVDSLRFSSMKHIHSISIGTPINGTYSEMRTENLKKYIRDKVNYISSIRGLEFDCVGQDSDQLLDLLESFLKIKDIKTLRILNLEEKYFPMLESLLHENSIESLDLSGMPGMEPLNIKPIMWLFTAATDLSIDSKTIDTSVILELPSPGAILTIDDQQSPVVLGPRSPFKSLTELRTSIYKDQYVFQQSLAVSKKKLKALHITGVQTVLAVFGMLNYAEKQLASSLDRYI